MWGCLSARTRQDVIEQAVFRDVRIVVPVKEDFDRGRDPFGSHLEILDLASGHRQIIYSSDEVFEAPNWTRDGKALIYNSRRSAVSVLTWQAGAQHRSTRATWSGTTTTMSSRLTAACLPSAATAGEDFHSLVYTVPLQGGQPKLITPTGPSYLHGWSPDGKFLVYCAQRNWPVRYLPHPGWMGARKSS